MTTLDAWRGISMRRADRGWPVRWVRGARAGGRFVVDAAGTLVRCTAGFGLLRLRCLLAGHGDRLVRAPGRLSLHCEECGRSTPGWTIAAGAPRVASQLPGRRTPFRVIPGRARLAALPGPEQAVAPRRTPHSGPPVPSGTVSHRGARYPGLAPRQDSL